MTRITHSGKGIGVAVSILISIIAFVFAAPAAQANHGIGDASFLKGTWVGTYAGYDNSGYLSGQEKFVITSVKGSNARGTWQSRTSASDKWSKPQHIGLSVYATNADPSFPELYISGGDANGVMTGKVFVAEKAMGITYTSAPQNLRVLTFDMKKR
jgi:hypothetical protein